MNDREIVERITRNGESQLYSNIVSRYSPQILSKVLALVKRRDLACEITQQAFIKAYTNLNTWRGSSLGAWINAIAMNASLTSLNQEKRRYSEPIEKADNIEREEYSEEREQMLLAMEKAISRLPETDKEIIRLHYYEGRKTDEIAQALGLTSSNVLVKMHRIRERLKKDLKDERNK